MILALPISLPSVANLREHWATKAKRVKAQRNAIIAAWRDHRHLEERRALFGWLHDGGTVVVTLSRVAPRKLDDDNLVSAFKAMRDEVANRLCVDDGSDAVKWRYLQTKPGPKATPGVVVIILPAPPEAAA